MHGSQNMLRNKRKSLMIYLLRVHILTRLQLRPGVVTGHGPGCCLQIESSCASLVAAGSHEAGVFQVCVPVKYCDQRICLVPSSGLTQTWSTLQMISLSILAWPLLRANLDVGQGVWSRGRGRAMEIYAALMITSFQPGQSECNQGV